MTFDSRKNLSFGYNLLNLLDNVQSNGTMKAKYTWLADGTKLRARDASGRGFDYVGSLTYNPTGLEHAQFSHGVIRAGQGSGSTSNQEINYHLTDHLGSVRAVIDGSGAVREKNDYYAFGAKHTRPDYPQNTNRFDFNGKESQDALGLSFLDYGARMYNPELGRWFNIDPLAEKYYPFSGYHFSQNNPIVFVDTNGMSSTDFVNAKTGEKFNYNDGSKRKVTLSDKEYDKMLFLAMRDQWNANSEWDQGDYEFYNYALQGGELAEYQGSASFDALGMSSLAVGALGDIAGSSNASFRFLNSKGAWDPAFYRNGWRGNQWVTTARMSNLAPWISKGGNILSILGISSSYIKYRNSKTFDEKAEHALDMGVGVFGFTPLVGAPVSAAWTLGGKKLYWWWFENGFLPQVEMGIHHYPSAQPFK